MAKRGVKVRDGENLTKESIAKVIRELAMAKPITKKEACAQLNIAYNTTRLDNIIKEHIESEEYSAKRRKSVRSTPISNADIKYICEAYLSEESLQTISNQTFRSTDVVKRVLKNNNIPLREPSRGYFNPPLLEEVQEEYEEGDLVYSAKYGKPATVMKRVADGVYRILFHGNHRSYANQPYYELADLTKLQKDYGVVMEDMPRDEVITLLNESLKRSNKRGK